MTERREQKIIVALSHAEALAVRLASQPRWDTSYRGSCGARCALADRSTSGKSARRATVARLRFEPEQLRRLRRRVRPAGLLRAHRLRDMCSDRAAFDGASKRGRHDDRQRERIWVQFPICSVKNKAISIG
jgi:hypothetical protein